MRTKNFRFLALIALLLTLALICCAFPAFAEEATAQISGTAWFDKDLDGIKENETTLSDVHVTLQSVSEDGSVQPVAETTTAKDGYFLFGSLPSGNYQLVAELPSDREFTVHGGDSAMLPASGSVSRTPVFTLENGESKTLNIGGAGSSAYINFFSFEDSNANGGRFSSEPMIRDVQVELFYEYDGVAYSIYTTATNKDGAVRIKNLTPGTYYAIVTPPDGYTFAPLGERVNAYYNCVSLTEDGLGKTLPLELKVKGSVGVGVGLVKTTEVEGSVWFDENANGQKDESEGGFAGLSLSLFAPELDITFTATSDENGVYRFEGLRDGVYELTAQLPGGVMFAGGDSFFTAYGAAYSQTATISVSVENETIVEPIGIMPDTTITFRAFEDANGNNVYDAESSDMPFAGALFTAFLPDGQELSITTDENGLAVLGNVRGGDLSLSCQLPEGYVFVRSSAEIPFSANVGVSSLTVNRTVANGQNTTVDAVVTKPVSINGKLFEDAGIDGIYSAECTFLPGFTVQAVDASGDIMAEAVTAADGSYAFSNLLPGDYTVRVKLDDPYIASAYAADQEGEMLNSLSDQTMESAQTPAFTLLPGESAVKHASVFKAGTVDGYVLLNPQYDQLASNEGGLSNVTVYLLDEYGAPVSDYSYDITDATGYFYIKGILPGTYSLSYQMPASAALTAPIPGAVEYQTDNFAVENGSALHAEDVGAVNTCSVSGFVLHADAAGASLPVDAIVRLIPEHLETTYETETMENGEYIITDIMPDTYTVEVTLPEGYVFDHAVSSPVPAGLSNTSSAVLDLNMGRVMTDANISAAKPAQFQGKMYYDLDASTHLNENETPVATHSLVLFNAHGDSYTVTTSGDGSFVFEKILPGNYTLEFKLDSDCIVSGFGANDGATWQVPVAVADGDMTASANIGVLRYASVSGAVWSMDGSLNGVSGLPIQLEKEGEPLAQTVTDAQGHYAFNDLYPGIYTVSTTLPEGHLFARTVDTALRQSYILEGDSVPFEVEMGAAVNDRDIGIGAVGAIGDTAWLDENKNGMLDLDEVGMPGIVIELYQYGELAVSTTTDVYGRYQLTDLFPGTYSMVVTMPAELKATRQQNEFPLLRSILPESDDATVTVENVIVPSGDTDLNWDLGFALREDGVYPAVMETIPDANWMPYSER